MLWIQPKLDAYYFQHSSDWDDCCTLSRPIFGEQKLVELWKDLMLIKACSPTFGGKKFETSAVCFPETKQHAAGYAPTPNPPTHSSHVSVIKPPYGTRLHTPAQVTEAVSRYDGSDPTFCRHCSRRDSISVHISPDSRKSTLVSSSDNGRMDRYLHRLQNLFHSFRIKGTNRKVYSLTLK